MLKKKILDSMSLKKLKILAKKYKISCFKKGTKICVKKSTLLKRLKENRSIKKILESAVKIKNVKKKSKYNFGLHDKTPTTVPQLNNPLELQTGKTYNQLLTHYKNIPTTLISTNFSPQINYARGSMGKSSLPQPQYSNKFGRYFH